MAVFEALDKPGLWRPTQLAAGPFAGLQGGAVAGLLTAEIEALAGERQWGDAVSAAAWFLRPTPMADLRTEIKPLRVGGRVNVVDNTLYAEGQAEPCATVRITLVRPRPVEAPGLRAEAATPADPAAHPQRQRKAPHGKPWFMDAMEARAGAGIAWFRMTEQVVPGAGPLSQALGPADWTHGIGRPLENVLADPNPNLTVHLLRRPQGEWLGIEPRAWWQPQEGIGMGSGILRDIAGTVGSVSMAVALLPFPKPAA